jgi:ribosomal protein S18 acetylase RimI-like enzyme
MPADTPASFLPVALRPARDSDRPTLAAQHFALNVHEHAVSPNRRTDPEGGEASLAETEERLARTGGLTLVAEMDGRVVGHLALTFETGPAYVRAEEQPYAYVAVLYVEPAQRGRGIARALLSEAERSAVARGFTQLMVSVQSGNAAAERAYDRFGFRPYSADLIKPLRPARSDAADAERR